MYVSCRFGILIFYRKHHFIDENCLSRKRPGSIKYSTVLTCKANKPTRKVKLARTLLANCCSLIVELKSRKTSKGSQNAVGQTFCRKKSKKSTHFNRGSLWSAWQLLSGLGGPASLALRLLCRFQILRARN